MEQLMKELIERIEALKCDLFPIVYQIFYAHLVYTYGTTHMIWKKSLFWVE